MTNDYGFFVQLEKYVDHRKVRITLRGFSMTKAFLEASMLKGLIINYSYTTVEVEEVLLTV